MTAKWSGQDDSERGEFSEYGRGRWNVPVLILTLAMLGLIAWLFISGMASLAGAQ